MLWLSDMLNGEKNIIFLEEGGKVRQANQRQPVGKPSSFRVRFIHIDYTQKPPQFTPSFGSPRFREEQRGQSSTRGAEHQPGQETRTGCFLLVGFGSKLGSFAGDSLEAGLDAGYRAA